MPLLEQEPKARPRTLGDVIGLAAEMEREGVRRYAELGAEMKRRGDHGLAAIFETMLEEERDHLAAIEHWSREAAQRLPASATQASMLPAEIARSWSEAMASAVLTPYRALSIAVQNEERGFAFYSYIAAHAGNDAVRGAAEELAREELRHAALLRSERRRAWRRERPAQPSAPRMPSDLLERAHEMERRAAARHRAIAARLSALGHPDDAAALAAAADDERAAAAALDFAADDTPAKTPVHPLDEHDRGALLRTGLAEAERVYDAYADAVDHPGTEADLLAAQDGSARAVRRLGLISARLYAPVS